MSGAQVTQESALSFLLARRQSGPDWLLLKRDEAERTFREHGVPTTQDEEWKYTSLREFAAKEWPAAVSGQADGQWFDPDGYRVLIVNGTLVSAPEVQGLRIEPITNSELAERHLGDCGPKSTKTATREIKPDHYPFGALNTARFESGLVVRVTGTIAKTIEICNVSQGDGLSFPRLLIVADPGSKAQIVESYVSSGAEAHGCVPVTEVAVGEDAHIEHVRIQDQGPQSTHIGLWQVGQEATSNYTSFNICFGSALARTDQTIWIGGRDCTTRLDGVVCAANGQHIDNHTRLDHALPDCNSFEIYKQVVGEKSTVVFNGKIFVHEDAQKTDAKQTNQALLLSPDATIDSKPQLEIFADDVKCTHGATVGQLEDLPLFYMRSRGISEEQARAVLVYAFAAEVLELIGIEPVKEELERMLFAKLVQQRTSMSG